MTEDPLDLIDRDHTVRTRELLTHVDRTLSAALNARDEYEDASAKSIDAERAYREAVQRSDEANRAFQLHAGLHPDTVDAEPQPQPQPAEAVIQPASTTFHDRSIYRIALRILKQHFPLAQDEYHRAPAREIHNAALEAGWRLFHDGTAIRGTVTDAGGGQFQVHVSAREDYPTRRHGEVPPSGVILELETYDRSMDELDLLRADVSNLLAKLAAVREQVRAATEWP